MLAQNRANILTEFDQLGDREAILTYISKIPDSEQKRDYFNVFNAVDNYKKDVLRSHDNIGAFWGQWKSDDEYKNSEAYFVNTYNDSLPDWEEKSKPNYDLANGFLGIPLDHTYNYINDKPTNILGITDESLNGGYRDQYKAKKILYSLTGGTALFGGFEDDNYKLAAVTDDERRRYNYIYATEGKDKANKYLKSIQDRLSSDYGQNLADSVSGNAIATIGFPVLQGLTNFKYGVKGLLENDAPINPYAIAGEQIKENINTFEIFGKDFGQVLYDLGTSTANMLPSIMVDMALGGTGKVGSFLMGASAAGNARQEALRQGYTQEQAWAYGLTIGTLEGSLQYILGGIGKLGGKGSSFVLKKLGSTSAGQAVSRYVANLSNGTLSAVLQAGGKLAKNMASEGFEEYLQDVINPLVRNITLGEDNEWGLKNFVSEDAIYSGILGALSAGVLEGGSTVSGVYNAHKAGQAALDSGVYKGAIDYAKLLDPECDAYQIASELQSGKRKENAANIGALYEAVSEYIAESKKLVKKGR